MGGEEADRLKHVKRQIQEFISDRDEGQEDKETLGDGTEPDLWKREGQRRLLWGGDI